MAGPERELVPFDPGGTLSPLSRARLRVNGVVNLGADRDKHGTTAGAAAEPRATAASCGILSPYR